MIFPIFIYKHSIIIYSQDIKKSNCKGNSKLILVYLFNINFKIIKLTFEITIIYFCVIICIYVLYILYIYYIDHLNKIRTK